MTQQATPEEIERALALWREIAGHVGDLFTEDQAYLTSQAGITLHAQLEEAQADIQRWKADRHAITARVRKLAAALRPLADIHLVRDHSPEAPDMIDAPDLVINPRHVREARAALSGIEMGGDNGNS